MKKHIFYFLVILVFVCVIDGLFSYNVAGRTEAAASTMEVKRESEHENGLLKKYAWSFSIKTTDILNDTPVIINFYKNNAEIFSEASEEKIFNNESTYLTGDILEAGNTYKITFQIRNSGLQKIEYSAQPGVAGSEIITKTDSEVQTVTPQKDNKPKDVYTLLAPIGSLKQAPSNMGDYFNIIFKIAIGLCAVLAVVMIVIGGFQYMGDESIFGKTEAKAQIKNALFGLFIALGAYALLNTINPDLLSTDMNIAAVTAEVGGDVDIGIPGGTVLPSGIICSPGVSNIPAIVRSFDGKMTYSKDLPKGGIGPNNTVKYDCSGFVSKVLECAGVSHINGGTNTIFLGAEKVTSINGTSINGVELQIGDIVGWRPDDNPQRYGSNGHVMIYIGGGQLADSHSSEKIEPGKALGIFPISKYKDYIKYIRRVK